jgi:hypothetical protein
MLNGGIQILSDKKLINKLENIVMIIIWIIIFCGGVFVLVLSLFILSINSVSFILGLLLGLSSIGASLYYLNKRILGGLK